MLAALDTAQEEVDLARLKLPAGGRDGDKMLQVAQRFIDNARWAQGQGNWNLCRRWRPRPTSACRRRSSPRGSGTL